jgi:hypothetical protein
VRGEHPASVLSRHNFGINYDAHRPLYDLAVPYRRASSPFEHLLLASGRHGGPLDLLFLVAGVDVYQFRLCESWPGTDLSVMCGCGMLAGDGPFDAVFPGTFFPASRTALRTSSSTPEGLHAVLAEVSAERVDAARAAAVLVELRADDHVVEQIAERLPLQIAGTLRGAIRERLRRFHEGVLTEDGERCRDAFLDARLVEITPNDQQLGSLMDRAWLPEYRKLLLDLLKTFGRPGLVFTADTHIVRAE